MYLKVAEAFDARVTSACTRGPAAASFVMMPCDLVQLIIERAYAGEKDHVKHALDLFVDFAAIFVRILVRSVSEAVEVLRVHMYSCIATMRCSIGHPDLCCCFIIGAWQRHGMHLQVILIQKQQREEEARRRSKRRS